MILSFIDENLSQILSHWWKATRQSETWVAKLWITFNENLFVATIRWYLPRLICTILIFSVSKYIESWINVSILFSLSQFSLSLWRCFASFIFATSLTFYNTFKITIFTHLGIDIGWIVHLLGGGPQIGWIAVWLKSSFLRDGVKRAREHTWALHIHWLLACAHCFEFLIVTWLV